MLETEPTLRDMERWKDRVELSLDSRQIFLLFFGCAVAACLLFVLGVMVGERVARNQSQAATAGPDPLAALDALGDEHEPGLAGAIGSAPHTLAVTAPTLAAEPPLTFHDGLTASGDPAGSATADGPLSALPAPAANAKTAATGTGPYTLQLSSFEDQADADKFAKHLLADGYNAVVYAAAVPGKGTWYRVRSGGYATKKDADDALAKLAKDESVTGYVGKVETTPTPAAAKPVTAPAAVKKPTVTSSPAPVPSSATAAAKVTGTPVAAAPTMAPSLPAPAKPAAAAPTNPPTLSGAAPAMSTVPGPAGTHAVP
jgi:cell division septation protein DedD